MNKKLKLAIPFAVLALSCGIAAGCSGNDPDEEHVHNYTQWANDDTYHWKVCPEDGAIDESSKEEHVFIAGVCDECGATQTPVSEVKYGTASGQIKLHKLGEYVTDFTGVTIDMGDDDVETAIDTATGTFTIEKAVVGRNYTMTISKSGYKSYSTTVTVAEGEDTHLGGTRGCTLEYEVFSLLEGWDSEYHDLSHVNDEDYYIGFNSNDGTKTLNVLSTDSYTQVAATLKIKYYNSTHSFHTQGIVLKFEDGKHLIVRYHNGDQVNGNIQYCNEAWNSTAANSLFGDDAGLNEWGENAVHTLLDAETAAIKEDGLDLTLILKDGALYTFFADKFVAKYDLPEGYADSKKVQIGYFAWNTASGAVFNYDINETVPENMQSTLNINVTNPSDGTVCTVTAAPQKDVYDLNEEVELTFTAPEGYRLDALTVGGVNMIDEVLNGKLTIQANMFTLDVSATFVKEQPIALDLTIKGKKLGTTTAALADGTTVTFKNTDYTFTVADGKISAESVVKGRYIVQVDGYLEQEIVFDETLTEVTLEYDLMENLTLAWNWGDNSNLAEQNDGKLTQVSGATQWVSSKDGYDSVSITATVVSGAGRQGVFIRFKGDSYANDKYVMIQKEGDSKVSWNGENNIWGNGSNLFGDLWTDYVNPLTDADLAKITAGEYELTLVRDRNKIHVFINGELYDTKTLDESYADMQCYVGVYCTDIPSGAQRSFRIEDASEYLTDVTITDNTAENANGTIEISENVTLGDTVTITIKPAQGYMLDTITATDKDSNVVTLTAGSNNTYTFVAAEKNYTVTATFKEMPATQAESSVTGIGLGAAAVDMNGKEITFKAASGTETKLTVAEGKVKGVLAAGEYTVSCDGFYDLTATVEEDGSFATDTALAFEKIIFAYNLINEPEANLNDKTNVGDSTAAASDGIIKATADGRIYEWSTEQYKDVAITVTLKSGNGNQGLIMRFNGQQKDVRVRFENTKAQWIGGGWWWGTWNIIDTWDFGTTTDYANPMSEALLAKYNGEGLTLTLVRKGGVVYALVDGEVYAAQIISDYATYDVRLSVFAEDVKSGYEIPFVISTDVDAILNAAKDTHNVLGVLGNWTVTDTTLSVNGNGYAEFAPAEDSTKECLTVKIAAKNSSSGNHTQGLIYRFDNGKWLAARIESNDNNSYIQYSEDALLPSSGGFIKGWTLVHNLTDEEKTAFNGDGIDLQLVRDGKYIYILLGGNVIDKVILSDEYATMDGVIAATVEGGTGTAYAYEYKTGENVVVPQIYAVTASVDGAAHGYNVSVDKSLAKNGDSVTVTITASQNWWSDGVWSYFPTAIVVDGQETALTTNDLTSIEANRCSYTYTIANVTADTTIQFKVTQLDCIQGLVKVSVDGEGGTAVSDSGENGYHWNDGCDVYITPAENYEIESITITRGENGTPVVITEGWGTADANGKYTYTVSGGITEQTTIVVKFKAKTT